MSLRTRPWWDELVQRLVDEPLQGLADEFGVTEDDAIDALLEGEGGGSIDAEPWWPEALRRLEAGRSLREVSRTFEQAPRRLRRGLARAGLKRTSEGVTSATPQALEPWIDLLGRQPDAAVAEQAGVSVERVKGERRRLGIDAYRPKPKKQKRRLRPGSASVDPVVIRRVARVSNPDAADAPNADPVDLSAVENLPPLEPAQSKATRRRGRMRIVRPDDERQRHEPKQELPQPKKRSKKPKLHGDVRVVSVEDVDISELVPDVAPTSPAPEPVSEVVEEVPEPSHEAPSEVLAEVEEDATIEAPLEEERAEGPPPQPVHRARRRVATSESDAAWHVTLPSGFSCVVCANDVLVALDRAAELCPSAELSRATVRRVALLS